MAQWLETAPEWALNAPGWLNSFLYNIYKCFIFNDRYMLIVRGLGNTLLLTLLALLIGVVIGVVISLVRVTWDKNGAEMRPAPRAVLGAGNVLSHIYLTVIRGTPVVVQMFIMFFVIFATSNNKILVGCLCFGINSGAYAAEIIRGGIMSVDAGQTEAGRSLGFNYVSAMRYVVLPQAFKNVLPSLANELIVLLKETAVVGYIGLSDLTYAAAVIRGVTYVSFYPLIVCALVYLCIVMLMTFFVRKLEKSLRKGG
jgi:His/Glu/Gln/Arg/opine family amino acid ABC transporter permease subunit